MRTDSSITAGSCRDEELPPAAAKAIQRQLSTLSTGAVRAGHQDTTGLVFNARL